MIFKRYKVIKKFGSNTRSQFKLTICDLNTIVAEEFCNIFKDFDEISVVEGDITKLKCDALVTAGNSFGDMGGGVDKAIDDSFNGTAQNLVQQNIAKKYLGELPVGTALTVYPNKKKALIYAPTMRIPGQITNTINPYLAFRAALIEATRSKFKHIVCPAFGCGIGGVSPIDSAEQMKTAFILIVYNQWKKIVHPAQAPYAIR